MWTDGEIITVGSGRPDTQLAREVYSTFCTAAKMNASVICWWCGKRPANNDSWDYDHVAPAVIESPGVLACSTCNRGRHGVIPSAEIMQRLLYSDKVLVSCEQEVLKSWLKFVAGKMFKSQRKTDMVIAYTWKHPIKLHGTSKPDKALTEEVESHGFPVRSNSINIGQFQYRR